MTLAQLRSWYSRNMDRNAKTCSTVTSVVLYIYGYSTLLPRARAVLGIGGIFTFTTASRALDIREPMGNFGQNEAVETIFSYPTNICGCLLHTVAFCTNADFARRPCLQTIDSRGGTLSSRVADAFFGVSDGKLPPMLIPEHWA